MTHFEKAIDYVRQKHSWNEHDEALALEDMVRYRCPIEFADDDIANEIEDLMERYGLENDLPKSWWVEEGDVNDIFWML
ncbi:MAG: hypothetical protein J5637_07865 [Prevotella sp.]|nr:hypothetical protein [Prevotella sp.]